MQIEHIKAVENIDEILAVPGVDGFIIGPYDLSGSLGVPGDFKDPRMIAALKKVKAAAKRHNMPAGYHIVSPDSADFKAKINEGYNFIAYGVDFIWLRENCEKGLAAIEHCK